MQSEAERIAAKADALEAALRISIWNECRSSGMSQLASQAMVRTRLDAILQRFPATESRGTPDRPPCGT